MRKLILITVLMLASASAFAGDNRSLTLTSSMPQPTVSSAPQLPVSQVATKLAQQAAPVTSQAPAVETQTQVQTTTPATETPAATTATTTTTTETAKPVTTADTQPTTKPATTKPAKKVSRWQSDEAKARHIAARYGVYW